MQRFLGLLDMVDGGGAGRSGQTFEGGPLSGFMNALGIRPMGYFDRLEAARPMGRPAMGRPAMGRPTMSTSGGMAPPAPMPAMPAPGQITTTALPPVGQLRDEDLIRLIMQGLSQAPSATGYGPR